MPRTTEGLTGLIGTKCVEDAKKGRAERMKKLKGLW